MARIVTTNGVLQTTNGVLQMAAPNPEIDYFEDADISEYGGETTYFTVQQTTVEDGGYALEGQSHSDGTETVLVSGSGDGLPNYPAAGDTWRWHAYLTDSGDVAVNRFGVQAVTTDPDGYRVQLSADADVIEVAYQLNGSYTELQQTPAPITGHLSEWLRCHVEWGTGGAINAYLYDAAGYEIGRNTGASDSQWSSGGTGWGAFNSATQGTMYFDTARLLNAIQPATIIESFRDGDIAEYAGDTLNFAVVSSPHVHAVNGLECQTGIDGGTKGISSTTGLNAYPSQGDTFWTAFRHPATDHRLQAAFAVQSESATSDCYAIQSAADNGAFNIVKWSGGSFSTLDSATLDYSGYTGTWLHAKLEWGTDGSMQATLYDDTKTAIAGPIAATDTTWTSGGWGWRILTGLASDTVGYTDFARITS